VRAFTEVINNVKEYALKIYPEDLLCQYQLLEKSFSEKNEADKKLIASKITKIKNEINKNKLKIDWEFFFDSFIQKVENNEQIPIKDIVTLEYAPEDMSEYVLRIAAIMANKRNKPACERIRLCKSIYCFTTCLKPCAYGSYGSCLFAARKDNEPSIAEKMFGNITTVDEYMKEIMAAKHSQFSNNIKLITTSHQVNKDVLEVILSTLKKARNDEELYNFPFCVSLGAVDKEQILLLKEAGATRINHNLEASYYNALYLSTISNNSNKDDDKDLKADSLNEYMKRLTTLITALENKIGICSGGMFFYGDDEIAEDRILLYLTLNELDKIFNVNSSPFNIFVPLKDIVDESMGWFSAFELSCVERKESINSFKIFKTLIAFSLIVPTNHKIVISAGSKWLGDKYYKLSVELGGGAGLASYLQQMDSHKTIEIAQMINNQYY